MAHGDALVGEMKGKGVSGVGSQQPCTVRPKALLQTMKACDKLARSTVSRELRSKFIQFLHHSFHVSFN